MPEIRERIRRTLRWLELESGSDDNLNRSVRPSSKSHKLGVEEGRIQANGKYKLVMIASTPLPPWQPPLLAPLRLRRSRPLIIPYRTPIGFVQAYRRGGGNNDAFGEAWNKVWRGANDGFEKFVFEARKTAERLDRRYSVSRRVSSAAQSVADRAREIDREFAIGLRWRNFTLDFSRNWPRVCTAD
ncbi:Replicase polyprotein 1ab [Cucumis melo var. makuwa]|uniref:Replicase polyprotein 1ab n=1 Tax=Cucumis melo var. makuwa TaxID=1194695 RepID=A0A5A7UKJ7_CUCMM|nr:Replicase polyprotein 1ab [Cucumis melo var. makuwa]